MPPMSDAHRGVSLGGIAQFDLVDHIRATQFSAFVLQVVSCVLRSHFGLQRHILCFHRYVYNHNNKSLTENQENW
jgi:hypothetical protein